MSRNDLLSGKIFPTMVRLSTPLMLTAFIQMAYSLTDIAWIGRLSTDAVAAAGQVGFLVWIASGFMLVPRIGMSVLTAQVYGRKDYDKARMYMNNGVWLSIIMGVIYGFLTLIFKNAYIEFFQLEGNVNQLAREYLEVMAMGIPLFFLNPVISGAYNTLGNSKTPFRINAIGLVTNIVLDPICIFGWGPIPAMGIRGAAIATVSAQIIVLLTFIKIIHDQNDIMTDSQFYRWLPNKEALIEMIKIGIPPSFQSNVHAIISIILNRYVAIYGAMPLAVTSVGSMIESISWMTTEGIAVAITAITGQNFGAQLMDRVKEIYKTILILLTGIGVASTLILILFRYQLFHLFIPNDPEAIALGAVYLFVFGLSQFFMTYEIGCSGYLNGLGDTQSPATVNSLFNILRVPMAWLFMPHFGVVGIWMAMSLSSVFKGIILYIMTRMKLAKLFK